MAERAVTGITGQITWLYTEDTAASWRFYEEALGLETVVDQGICRVFAVGGGAHIGVCAVHEGRAVAPEGCIVSLVTDDVEGAHARLVARGAEVDGPPFRNAALGITHFMTRDPSGYRIEIERFEDHSLDGPPRRG